MKNLIVLLLIFVPFLSTSFAQQVEYDKYSEGLNKYSSYISKSGDVINIGDTLVIGKNSGLNRFNFITQGEQPCGVVITGKKVIITQIRTYKNNLFLQFKGWGLPCYISYEPALDAKEIINTRAKMTSEEAVSLLKKYKDKLDLQLITQEEYNQKKVELVKFIK